jgi:hypothetical protein
MRTGAAALALVLFAAVESRCQAVRGVAIAPDSSVVPGVIVTLLDDKGRPVARALGDDEGRFAVRAPAAGMYQVEARRIGFRPTLEPPMLLEDGEIRLYTLMLRGTPVSLAAVRTVASSQCDAAADSASSAFAVWEEARKALLSSELTRLTRAYKVDVTTYVKKQGVEITPHVDSALRTGLPIRPFTSQPPELLAEKGYLTRSGRSLVFHAPDEEVLLSDAFAATHCLTLLPDSAGLNGLRLGFAPVPGRHQPEITGVLTIDRVTSELQRLDFTFVNLPTMDAVGSPGGQIAFRRLPEGSWLIDEWAIWVPIAELRTEPTVNAQLPTRGGPPRGPTLITTKKVGLQTTGGHVTRVAFGDETVWTRTMAKP